MESTSRRLKRDLASPKPIVVGRSVACCEVALAPNVLMNGATYFADIRANYGSWEALDVDGYGFPYDNADCVTALFSP